MGSERVRAHVDEKEMDTKPEKKSTEFGDLEGDQGVDIGSKVCKA